MANILVIEDDAEMQDVLVASLEDAGHAAKGASSADEGIEMARKFPFDLVISDVRMAGHRDGLGALEVLKKRLPQLRCIVITGFTSPDAPSRALGLEVDDYVYKPFRLPEFMATVQRVLNPRRSQYVNLLNSIWSAPKRLLEKLDSQRQEAARTQLQRERERCYQSYYLAIRSNMIFRDTALEVFDRLEEADNIQNDLASSAALYQTLHNKLVNQSKSKGFADPKPRVEPLVSRKDFNNFYDRVQKGELQPDHLMLATQLRRLPSGSDGPSQEMARFIWGAR